MLPSQRKSLRIKEKAFDILEKGIYQNQHVYLMEDVDQESISYEGKSKSPCGYCGYGDSRFVVCSVRNEEAWLCVENFCGCMTYYPLYTCHTFDTFYSLLAYLERYFPTKS